MNNHSDLQGCSCWSRFGLSPIFVWGTAYRISHEYILFSHSSVGLAEAELHEPTVVHSIPDVSPLRGIAWCISLAGMAC